MQAAPAAQRQEQRGVAKIRRQGAGMGIVKRSGDREALADRLRVVLDIAMADSYPFGHAGGAGGEQHIGARLALDPDDAALLRAQQRAVHIQRTQAQLAQ